MATSTNIIFSIFVRLILLQFYASLADISPHTLTSPYTACNLTLYPDDCKSILFGHVHGTIYDYGRFSIHRSISFSQKFLSLINTHLQISLDLSISVIRPLLDCQFLAQLNIDFLLTSSNVTSNVNKTLPTFQADGIHTLLSAVLTNQQTCLDGLEAISLAQIITDDLRKQTSDGSKLYSISLALYANSWLPKIKSNPATHPKRKQIPFGHGHKPLNMSRQRRKLLQTSGEAVKLSNIVTVSQDGNADYTRIEDAITAAPNNTNNSTGYYLIYVIAGVYQEYVTIPANKKYIMMIGDGISQTVITGNRTVSDGWTTYKCATFVVEGLGFVAMDITFQNTAGPNKGQAVAMRNSADMTAFYRCSFEGYQDTLYAHSMRQFYRECDIYGTIDFIFGNAAVIFQNCNVYPRLPLLGEANEISAQGRLDPNQNTGTSFHNCTIKATPELASSSYLVQTFLGRPWFLYSQTVYMQNFMDSLIDPAGWDRWIGDYALNTSYLAEFNNSGPGSSTANRVTWPCFHKINATVAQNFTVNNFISGDYWLPLTGVSYFGGLL